MIKNREGETNVINLNESQTIYKNPNMITIPSKTYNFCLQFRYS